MDAYGRFRDNPSHPGLQFKPVVAEARIYSVRISRSHRALGVQHDHTIIWFWIGSHDAYERMIATLRAR